MPANPASRFRTGLRQGYFVGSPGFKSIRWNNRLPGGKGQVVHGGAKQGSRRLGELAVAAVLRQKSREAEVRSPNIVFRETAHYVVERLMEDS